MLAMPCSNIVAGRIVNCYTEEDWILGFVHRTLSAAGGVAGMHAIDGVTAVRAGRVEDGIENIDVSGIVSGHLEYATQMPHLLHLVGLADKPPEPYVAPKRSFIYGARPNSSLSPRCVAGATRVPTPQSPPCQSR
jgi:hypothetical protein